MKRRPTEIPYIPKDKRRSRFAPREGGTIIESSKGVEALRQTNDGARDKPKKEKQGGCGCLVFAAVFLFISFGDNFTVDERGRDLKTAVGDTIEGFLRDNVPRAFEDEPEPASTSARPAGLARAPLGELADLFSGADYPPEALAAGEEGTVRVELDLDADGLVDACTVTQSSGSEALDQATCTIFRTSARFVPSRDEAGNAVPSRYAPPPIRWEIPRQ